MLSLQLGPIALPMIWATVFVAYMATSVVAWLFSRYSKQNIDNDVFYGIVLALIVARIGFVVQNWSLYQLDWLQIINIRDGGMLWWLAGLVWLTMMVVSMIKKPKLGWQIAVSMLFGFAVTSIGFAYVHYQETKQQLPDVMVLDLNGHEHSLTEFKGKPIVINLWATWCPPCQKEMPVFEAAQQENPDVEFVFVNQGEGRIAVEEFLAQQNLQLDNVVLDSHAKVGDVVGSTLLPTTLFYQTNGQLESSHLGELTAAGLKYQLEKIR